MRLAATGRIEIVEGRVRVRDSRPTGDPLLDDALADLPRRGGRQQARAWIARVRPGLAVRYLRALAAEGAVAVETRRALGLFRVSRWHVLDHERLREVRARLDRIAASTGALSPEDTAFAGLTRGQPATIRAAFSTCAAPRPRRDGESARGWRIASCFFSVQSSPHPFSPPTRRGRERAGIAGPPPPNATIAEVEHESPARCRFRRIQTLRGKSRYAGRRLRAAAKGSSEHPRARRTRRRWPRPGTRTDVLRNGPLNDWAHPADLSAHTAPRPVAGRVSCGRMSFALPASSSGPDSTGRSTSPEGTRVPLVATAQKLGAI